jgi:fermentation-respiration switch protein FrsA (DUF1100 family)
MKKLTPVLALALSALLMSSCLAGKYMANYALKPKIHGVEDIERTRHKADSLMPGSTAWYDSLKTRGVLKDTFIVGYNNKRVHAVFAPAPKPQEAQGTAIIVHGYGDNHMVFIYLARMYREQFNYNVLMPDLQYHGYSEGDSIQMGWLDRYDILNWINVAYSVFPNDFMVLHGVSMGAATVMMTSGESLPDYVRCFVEDCGYNSVQGQFANNLKDISPLIPKDILNSASIVTNRLYGWYFKHADCSKMLANCYKPMLFIHGDADDFVPFENLWLNYNAKTHGYKEYWVAEGAVHANSYAKYPEEYTRRVGNFLKTVHNMIEDGSIYE